jgi:hypothetical protein
MRVRRNAGPYSGQPSISLGDIPVDIVREAKKIKGGAAAPPVDATAAIYEYLLDQVDVRLGWAQSLGSIAIDVDRKVRGAKDALKKAKIDTMLEFRLPSKAVTKWTSDAKEMLKDGKAITFDVSKLERFKNPEELIRRVVIHPGTYYFASGSNHPGEIHGFVELSQASGGRLQVGIAVDQCMSKDMRKGLDGMLDTACLDAVKLLSRHPNARLFVDSGAFSEVMENPGGPPVPNPKKKIKDKAYKSGKETILGWRERLAAYLMLARHLGPQAYLVAPDLVANQEKTLERMVKYRDVILECAGFGANILVPIQRNPYGLTTAQFYAKVRRIYSGVPVIPALPMKKGATSLEELAGLLDSVREPIHAMHFLGLGPGGKIPRYSDRHVDPVLGGKATSDEVIELVRSHPVHGGMTIMHDSVLVRSAAGRGFLGLDPRLYTIAQDVVYREILPEAYYESRWGTKTLEGWIKGEGWGAVQIPSYEDNLTPAVAKKWITPYQRQRFLHLVRREDERAGGPKGKAYLKGKRGPQAKMIEAGVPGELDAAIKLMFAIGTWRPGKRPGTTLSLTSEEEDLLLSDPGRFFSSEVAPWDPEFRGFKWSDPQIFGTWLDLEWGHYLTAERAARRKREGILRAWSIVDPGERRRELEAVAPSASEAANEAVGELIGEAVAFPSPHGCSRLAVAFPWKDRK